ncbi:MAG: LytR C-terminal domain-containing protein, partial [Actinomycetota bacterium]|nr:LytR C-terminal domain-containing protein [Actinomycetota bacterium]
ALAGSLPPVGPEGPLRVLVENGVCVPDIDRSAARLLRGAGFVFVPGGNASGCAYDKSVVIIADASPEELARGEAVAKSLGLPRSSIRRASTGQQVADVIVILGADFDPQYQPDES